MNRDLGLVAARQLFWIRLAIAYQCLTVSAGADRLNRTGSKNAIDAVIVMVGFTTVLVMVLVFALSLRLRQNEIDTMVMIGCSRMTATMPKGDRTPGAGGGGASYPAENI